jgi:hypothetical protein
MTEAEFLAQVEVWALGGLTEAEQAQMEAFLAGTPSSAARAAHRRAFEIAALIAAALPPAPPAPAEPRPPASPRSWCCG